MKYLFLLIFFLPSYSYSQSLPVLDSLDNSRFVLIDTTESLVSICSLDINIVDEDFIPLQLAFITFYDSTGKMIVATETNDKGDGVIFFPRENDIKKIKVAYVGYKYFESRLDIKNSLFFKIMLKRVQFTY